MFCITVTVHDHQDLDCRIHSVKEHHNYPADNLFSLSRNDVARKIREARDETVELHRETYPRNKNFVSPVVEITVTPNAEGLDIMRPDLRSDLMGTNA